MANEAKRASEEIYIQIRQDILDGKVKTGDRLPSERKMMEMMQRSRPTIREAMRMLERDGYIKTIPGSSGAIVQECSVDYAVQSIESIIQFQKLTLENILEFRMVDETQAAKLASHRRTEEDLMLMKDILDNAKKNIDNPNLFIEYDVLFHMQIAKAAKNEMFSIMLQVCRNITGESLLRTVSDKSEDSKKKRFLNILSTHYNIYESIKNKDEKTASQEMFRHLKDAESDLLGKQV